MFLRNLMRPPFRILAGLALPLVLCAAPLSQQTRIDFYRDVPSRNLQGLATRSDGRLLAGPVLRDFTGDMGVELLWSLTRGEGDEWLVGTGPTGMIRAFTMDHEAGTVSSRDWGKVEDAHVYALHRLPDGRVLAGSSPGGGLHLLRDGVVVASLRLPVDSIFDILPSTKPDEIFVGTGNPGRIYRVNLATLAEAGVQTETMRDPAALSAAGIERFGSIRDRNVRRLAQAADGRILAGSAPSGKLYAFPRDGGAPELLLDHSRAEITDLRVEENGDIFALVVHSGTAGQPMRALRPLPVPATTPPEGAPGAPVPEDEGDQPAVERFGGRSVLIWIPGGDGFPETLASRPNIAFYRMAPRGDTMLISGGDAGEIIGFDRKQRRSLTFSGSSSAQLSGLVAFDEDRYLLLRNNPAGVGVLDFSARGTRRAETRRIDLRSPGTLGALRFSRLREVSPQDLRVTLRANRADDEVEGWTPWRPSEERDGGWFSPDLRGRYAQLRIELPETLASDAEVDAATLHFLPQNRRPVLQAFRVISPNFALVPRPEPPAAPLLTLGQVIGSSNDAGGERRNSALLASQLVPEPGAQVIYWTLDDPDGDELLATFSLRRDGSDSWTDVAVDTREPWVQFNRAHFEDGIYHTRLLVREVGARPAPERLQVTLETDDLVIDQTAPVIEWAAVERRDGRLVFSVQARDGLSLLAGIEVNLNNGYSSSVEHPADGVLDSVAETFVAEILDADASRANSAEIILYDAVGNSTSRRLALP